MKTYAAKTGNVVFDWHHFLSDANQATLPVLSKHFYAEWYKAYDLASLWTTCACGSQCEIIPRNEIGRPLDPQLADAGARFFRAIDNYQVKEAREILSEIEERSAQLIHEILHGEKT